MYLEKKQHLTSEQNKKNYEDNKTGQKILYTIEHRNIILNLKIFHSEYFSFVKGNLIYQIFGYYHMIHYYLGFVIIYHFQQTFYIYNKI